MTLVQAIILGIVQGLTEFVPISSSAHLIIIPWLFRWTDPGLAFDIALHLGTLVALLWYFAADWVRLVRAGIASIIERKIGNDTDRRLAWFLVIGTIPGAIAGWLGESKIEELFHQPDAPHTLGAMIAMAIIIALLGVALFVAERIARHRPGTRPGFTQGCHCDRTFPGAGDFPRRLPFREHHHGGTGPGIAARDGSALFFPALGANYAGRGS